MQEKNLLGCRKKLIRVQEETAISILGLRLQPKTRSVLTLDKNELKKLK